MMMCGFDIVLLRNRQDEDERDASKADGSATYGCKVHTIYLEVTILGTRLCVLRPTGMKALGAAKAQD